MKRIETDEDVLQIWWNEDYPIDLIQGDEFNEPCENVLGTHELGWPDQNKRCKAKFIKKIDGSVATFDYSDDRVIEKNKDNDLDIGVMKIYFTEDNRSTIKEVCWIDSKGNEDKNAASTSWDLQPDLDDDLILPEEDEVQREIITRKERRLQTRFRDTLLHIYKNTCCLSDCNIPEALEAAHIVPSSSPKSFDPRNGLLLRADLHKLFDKNMLGIDPFTRTVKLSKVLADSQQYNYLADKKIRDPNKKKYNPIDKALQRKWEKFKP